MASEMSYDIDCRLIQRVPPAASVAKTANPGQGDALRPVEEAIKEERVTAVGSGPAGEATPS